jgi:hypothetical protein
MCFCYSCSFFLTLLTCKGESKIRKIHFTHISQTKYDWVEEKNYKVHVLLS